MSYNTRNKIKGDKRPSDYEYALISRHVYSVKDTTLEVGTKYVTPFRTWRISFVSARSYCGYFGAVYECEETKQYVIGHRGTNGFMDVIENYVGVFKNRCSNQKTEALRLVELVIQKIKGQGDNNCYTLSFTGHSLGAFLAELSIYFATVIMNFPSVNCVTFESPGSLQSMKSICWHTYHCSISVTDLDIIGRTTASDKKYDTEHLTSWPSLTSMLYSSCASLQSFSSAGFYSIAKKLDIISYVCYPNIVNIVNEHVGTLYAINVTLEDQQVTWPCRLISSHSILGIVDWFERFEANDPRCICLYMADWPKKYSESQVFFKHATYEDNVLSVNDLVNNKRLSKRPSLNRYLKTGMRKSLLEESSRQFEKWVRKQKQKFELQFHGNFHVVQGLTSPIVLPLRHFSQQMQNFLQYFYKKREFVLEEHKGQEEAVKSILKATWQGFHMEDKIAEELLVFELQKNQLFLEEVVCKRVNVHQFRQQLSCWLVKSGFTVDELIDETLIKENMT